MTIGIGMLCPDGIILCSDQQHTATGSHKFFEPKLHKIYDNPMTWIATFAYAGQDSLMDGFLGAFKDHMSGLASPVDCESIRVGIESALLSRYLPDDIKEFQLICGAVIPGKEMRLFQNTGHRIGDVDSSGLSIVGCGESSALRQRRFLILNGRPIRNCEHGIWVAVSLVQVAKDWVDQCGGPTDVWQLGKDGSVVDRSSLVGNIEGSMKGIDGLISNAIAELGSCADEEQFDMAVSALERVLRERYKSRKSDLRK